MNDFDYDCMLKKRLARNDAHKKRGSKSRKCSLPSDHLTPKQWRERCGAVMSVCLNRPVSWSDFKLLSRDLQEEYIRGLLDTYHINTTSLAEMFGLNVSTIRRYFAERNLNIKFRVGNSMNAEQRAQWENFLSCGAAEQSEAAPETPVMEGPEPQEEREEQTEADSDAETPSKMTEFSMTFSGKIDPLMIANSLLGIIGMDAVGEIRVTCRLG